MVAKKKHTFKKSIVIAVSILLVGALAYATYLYYVAPREDTPKYTADEKHEADHVLEKYNLDIEKDIAQEYTILVQRKDYDGANKVFSESIRVAADDEKRSALYKQHILLALANGLPDQALIVANDFISFKPSYESYAEAARVYTVKFDKSKQIEFYQKALDDIKTREVNNRDQYIAYYEGRLTSLQEAR